MSNKKRKEGRKEKKKYVKKYKSWPSSSSLSFPSFREEKRGKRIEEGIYIAFFPLYFTHPFPCFCLQDKS